MEVHRQRCQACGGLDHRNLIVRQPGAHQTVYVRCVTCEALVARYELATYYHHGRGLASWMRGVARATLESGRALQQRFEQVVASAEAGYAEALDWLARHDKPV